MIKRTITYSALALLTLGFAACQQEEDFAPQGQEINLNITAGGVQTRVNTLGTGNVWENGDQVKIERMVWAVSDASDYYTYTASVDESGTPTWTPDKKLYWNGKEEHILAAFYPVAGQDDYISFEFPHSQRTLEQLKSADCMNAVWVGDPTTDVINFQMKHRLSMVTINYEFASEFTDAYISDVYVMTLNAPIMFDLREGKMEEISGALFNSKVHAYHDAVNKTIQAIVIPCTYPEGQLFMEIKVGSETLQVKMPEAKTFEEGTLYTFDLKVGKDKVTLTEVSASNDFPGNWYDNDNYDDDVNLNN